MILSYHEKVELVKKLKKLLREVGEGADMDELRERFGHVLSRISPLEISLIEQ